MNARIASWEGGSQRNTCSIVSAARGEDDGSRFLAMQDEEKILSQSFLHALSSMKGNQRCSIYQNPPSPPPHPSILYASTRYSRICNPLDQHSKVASRYRQVQYLVDSCADPKLEKSPKETTHLNASLTDAILLVSSCKSSPDIWFPSLTSGVNSWEAQLPPTNMHSLEQKILVCSPKKLTASS